MITIVILGIITSIAIPAYERYVREARRSEARAALTGIAAQQAEFILNHSVYAASPTDLGYVSVSENGYYSLTVSATGATAFTAQASATGMQASDGQCAVFRITQTGARSARTASSSDSTADCW